MLNDYDKEKNTFIILWRSLMNWEWYTEVNTCKLFIHCLLKANHKEKNHQGITINRGSFLTSRGVLAFETGLSEMQVRTAIKNLKKTKEISVKTTSHYSIITVNNYNLYQNNNQQDNQHLTSTYPALNQHLTTTNKYNNDNNVNNILLGETKNKNFIIPSLEEIKNYCIERKNNINAEHFYDYYSSKGWMIGKNKMKDWKAAVRTWERNKFSTNPITEKQQVEEEYNFGIG